MRVRWVMFSVSGIVAILLAISAIGLGFQRVATQRQELCAAQNKLRQANRAFLRTDLGHDLGLDKNPQFKRVLDKADRRFRDIQC